MRFGVDVQSSDYLINRIFKELQKRLLTVQSVFKVRCLSHQLLAERKWRRVGEGLDLILTEQEADAVHDSAVHTYLNLSWTLMFAYARAGSSPRSAAPSGPETEESDSAEFVEVPLDILLNYHQRMVKVSQERHFSRALELVQKRDERERQIWVERHRAGQKSLGQIVKEVSSRGKACGSSLSPT